jgi:hypothetical protein
LTFNPQASRVTVLLRLMGLIFFVLGASLSYFTYTEAAQGNVVPEITPVFYLVSGILIVSGLLAVTVKYR